MVKRAAAAITLAMALAGGATAAARAQILQRVSVDAFALSADTPMPRVDTPFHLVLSLHVRQRVEQIENLDLPLLAQLELLGDERETTSSASGTLYRETITVVAHDAGTIAIAPATLQAIDARDGKAKEWFTNSLTLRVAGPSGLQKTGGVLVHGLLAALQLLILAIGIGCLIALVLVLVRRRRATAPVVFAPAPAPAPTRPRSPREQLQDALAVLRTERTRAAAVAVRGAIWRMLGASEGETLGDVLRRPESRDETTRGLLIALERSAFTYDGDLKPAIEDACWALERSIGAAA